MNQQRTKFLKHYYKQIKAFFPSYGRPEQLCLQGLKENIKDYILLHPECTYQEIRDKFGEPKDIIADYLDTVDADYLYKQIRRTKIIRRGVISCIIIILCVCSIHTALVYKSYVDGKNAIVVQEETEIKYVE